MELLGAQGDTIEDNNLLMSFINSQTYSDLDVMRHLCSDHSITLEP